MQNPQLGGNREDLSAARAVTSQPSSSAPIISTQAVTLNDLAPADVPAPQALRAAIDRVASTLEVSIAPIVLAQHWKLEKLPAIAPAHYAGLLSAVADCLRGPEMFDLLVKTLEITPGHSVITLKDIQLEHVLGHRKVCKPRVREYLTHELGIPEPQANNLLSRIATALVRTADIASCVNGDRMEASPVQRVATLLAGLGLPWLPAAEASKIAEQATSRPLPEIAGLALVADELAMPPVSSHQYQQRHQLHDRWRRALLATLLRSDPATEEKVVTELPGVLHRLFTHPGITLHLYHYDNSAVIMQRLRAGIQHGSMTLNALSCPDYSGKETLDDHGERHWAFDFLDLGTDVGVVARKGVDYVCAWLSALMPAVPRVVIQHYEPTFEVAQGFKSADGAVNLSSEAAQRRLEASNSAIQAMYAARGVHINASLSSSLIPDPEFRRACEDKTRELLLRKEADSDLGKLMEHIYLSRQALYRAWHPALVGESPEEHRARILETVVLQQVAEYIVVGEVLGAGEASLVLAYDSAPISEINGLEALPVFFGQGKSALRYLGD